MTQERCKATHVVQCDYPPGHDGPHLFQLTPGKDLQILEHYWFSWNDGDPQPRIEITPEHLHRFAMASGDRFGTMTLDEGRKLLDFVFNGFPLESNGDTK